MGRKRVPWALTLVTVVLLVLIWSATAEVPRYLGEPFSSNWAQVGGDQLPVSGEEGEEGEPQDWLRYLMQALLIMSVAVAGVLALLLILVIIRKVSSWRLGRRADRSIPTDDVDDLQAAADATGSQAWTRIRNESTPRNAVVACWASLEDAAEAAGLKPDHSETSEEFTQRVLHHWEVEHSTVTDLADLYRQARFSRHALDESDRSRAAEALEDVHSSIQVRRTHADAKGIDPPR